MKINPSEFQEQVALCDWLDLKRILYYSIKNEGKRSRITGAKLKKSGMKKGVPDMCIPVPTDKYGALYIEMKKIGEKPFPEQLEWKDKLNNAGNKSVICYGFDEAKKVVEEYFA